MMVVCAPPATRTYIAETFACPMQATVVTSCHIGFIYWLLAALVSCQTLQTPRPITYTIYSLSSTELCISFTGIT